MLDNDIKMFLSQEVSDNDTNGGRMNQSAEVISGVVQNVWDHVPKALRDTGNAPNGQDRKVHIANRNSSNEPLLLPAVIYDGDTLGSDYAFFFPVSHDAEQSDWRSGAEIPSRMFVSGVLKTTITPTATTLTIVFANAAQSSHVLDADYVWITNKTTPDAVSGNAVERQITGTPSTSSNEATINLTQQVGYDFEATTTKICVMYKLGVDLEPTLGTVTETVAGAGELDEAQITLDNKGSIRQVLTLTFSDANNFTVASDEPGVSLAAGSIGSQYAPLNPLTSTPYLTIPIAAWTAGFTLNDEIEIPINPGNIPQVQRRVVPSSCPSLANNRLRVVGIGESQT